MGDLVDPEKDPVDAVPELDPEPVSRRSDLWLLDQHRLLCGDATAASDVCRLMGTETAAMVFTTRPITCVSNRFRVAEDSCTVNS